MDWIGEPTVAKGVSEARFDLKVDDRLVPGLLWRPADAEPRALVLCGHGGSGHKRMEYVLATARRLVRHHGIAAMAIDGPAHGDRRADGGLDRAAVSRDSNEAWIADGAVERIVADWRGALDATLDELGDAHLPVGWFGVSMGTTMGVPVVAAEPRIGAAVLGLMGRWTALGPRLAELAPSITVPVRFLVQWDDELVPRERALVLFDLIGSTDKELRAHPGAHEAVPAREFAEIPAFLADHLLPHP